MYIFLHDRVVPEHEATVSVFDHGFLYGDGIYETMRAYDGTVFMLDRHLERLDRSAALIRLKIPELQLIRAAIYETLQANRLKSAYVRVTVSRGKGPIGLDPALCPAPTLVVIAEEFRPISGTSLCGGGSAYHSQDAEKPCRGPQPEDQIPELPEHHPA